MRTAELKKGKRYATCHGVLVEPLSPIHPRYKLVRWKGENGNWYDEVVEDDPWGPCHVVPGQRVLARGVKVRKYRQIDRHGNPEGEGYVTVIRPQEIAGPWSEYLALHGEKVRRIADEREEQKQLNELNKDVTAAAEKLGFSGRVKTWFGRNWINPRNKGDRKRYWVKVEIQYEFDDVDEYKGVLRELKRKRAR